LTVTEYPTALLPVSAAPDVTLSHWFETGTLLTAVHLHPSAVTFTVPLVTAPADRFTLEGDITYPHAALQSALHVASLLLHTVIAVCRIASHCAAHAAQSG
jgi:hypothetical protein